ncbi:MAG TPA: TlpA disulfide reductase family protein [Candidatus Paceibacterota bacterium]|nr:TlpA disulfide reductase family protein [Candidatus Paceibacterota bacterium]
MNRPKILTIFVISSIVLSGCSSQSTVVPKLGTVVGCESIPLSSSNEGVEIPCLDGNSTVHFNQLKGPLILNVWGSWCAPCKEEIPIFRSFYSKAKTQIRLLGVNVEEAKRTDATNFVIENGMTWPNLTDPDGRTRGLFGMGVPVTWFIDTAGKVVYKKIGVLRNEAELRTLASKYLNITVG